MAVGTAANFDIEGCSRSFRSQVQIYLLNFDKS